MFQALAKYNETPPFVALGYEPKTTFWGDFGVADVVGGASGIKDTFKRAFRNYKDDKEYATELAMVLNHKCWEWYDKDEDIARLYNRLYEQIDTYITDNWTGEKLDYYLRTTD